MTRKLLAHLWPVVGMAFAAPATAAPLALTGATIVDSTGQPPISNGVVIVDAGRIVAIGRAGTVRIPAGATVRDLRGKYLIPGMLDANVHLMIDAEPALLAQYAGHYPDLILEAAQVELKNGVTTVFDTWGPAADLKVVRDAIDAGTAEGSRIYYGGNIIGMDGPMSTDMLGTGGASQQLADQVNLRWTGGMGRELQWLTAPEVRQRTDQYIAERHPDFIKYLASGHVNEQFITFSPLQQRAIVDAAHDAHIRVIAHTTSVESLRLAVDAGVFLGVHCTATGPVPIPADIIAGMKEHGTVCGTEMRTQRALDYAAINDHRPGRGPKTNAAVVANTANVLKAGITVALATDGGLFAASSYKPGAPLHEMLTSPDYDCDLRTGEFLWFQAAAERGWTPQQMLQAATRNVAIAYGVIGDLGTLERGKRADIVVLDADPLAGPITYKAITAVMKDGKFVDRARLPVKPIYTAGGAASAP